MAKVLLVDDDEDVQTVLGRYLERDGHSVRSARTAEEALREAAAHPDVVILDLTLPDLDGLRVLGRLRQDGDMPVLVLSARGEESDRLLGLGLGADDYVVKPFSPREVCLRVAALVRRSTVRPQDEKDEVLLFGDLELRPSEHRMRVHGRELDLTPREFDLLELFLRHPRQVLSRQAILSALWSDGFVSDHVVDVHLASLRRKLGQTAAIENVRGIGYRISSGSMP